jgi:hypothetical protein
MQTIYHNIGLGQKNAIFLPKSVETRRKL